MGAVRTWASAALALLFAAACFTGVRLALSHPDLSSDTRRLLLRMSVLFGLLALIAVALELALWSG